MLKELFESSFFLVYPIKGNKTPCLLQSEKKGSFSLIDETACASCIRPCYNKDGQREQLCLFSNDSVNILKLDQVFELLQDSYGDNCDFVLDGHQVFMLLEMKCCQAKYSESERCKARNQLYHTIYVLKNVPVINKHIVNSIKKYVIFSWKITSDNDNNDDMVAINMTDMTSFVDETYSIDNESYFDNDFYYKEVRYPDILNWDNLKNI